VAEAKLAYPISAHRGWGVKADRLYLQATKPGGKITPALMLERIKAYAVLCLDRQPQHVKPADNWLREEHYLTEPAATPEPSRHLATNLQPRRSAVRSAIAGIDSYEG
jgi:hypothetical protein